MGDYWKDNGITKPSQVVVCAACRFNGVILCGARHFDNVMLSQIDHMVEGTKPSKPDEHWEQGFIDQFGDFLTREEAMAIVKENGQPFNIERNRGDTVLFSEGLY